MKTNVVLGLLVLTLSHAHATVITVMDWQFNTVGNLEGWTGSQTDVLDVRAAVSGTENVLSAGSQADPKIFFNPDIASPGNLINWQTLTFRFRQLDASPLDVDVAPQAFISSGTIVSVTGAGGSYGGIPAATGGNYTVSLEANEWRTVAVDLTKGGTESFTTPITQIRIDPAPGGSVDGFEVDYVTLTAVVPEPSSMLLLLCGFLAFGFVCRRRF